MELEQLKKTWDKLAGDKELDETQLKNILGKRTITLMDRIYLNIKIGLGVLLLLITLFIVDDYLISPRVAKSLANNVEMPQWIQFLYIFSNVLIITTFIYFFLRYIRIRKNHNPSVDLHKTLKQTIETLTTYKRMFYVVLFTFFVTFGAMFSAGLYQGITVKASESGILVSEISSANLALVLAVGILIFTIVVAAFLYFLHWGFNRLYGNYIKKLKQTLAELETMQE